MRLYKILLLVFVCSLIKIEFHLFSLPFDNKELISLQESIVTFPAADDDNRASGFVRFDAGFTLEDNTTTFTFDSLFPISGTINLNSGSLYMHRDLTLSDNFDIATGGKIYSNNYAIKLGSYITGSNFPSGASTTLTFSSTALVLNSNLQANGNWRFNGPCKIYGNGNTITFGSGSIFGIDSSSSLKFENVKLKDVSDNNIRCFTDDATITLQNCDLQLSRDFTFSRGSILFSHDVTISGTSKLNYSSVNSSTIDSLSTLLIDRNLTFSYDPDRANKSLLYMEDITSTLFLNGCTLYTTHTGLKLSTGTLVIDNSVTFSSEGRNNTESIELDSDLDIDVLSNACLKFYGRICSI